MTRMLSAGQYIELKYVQSQDDRMDDGAATKAELIADAAKENGTAHNAFYQNISGYATEVL